MEMIIRNKGLEVDMPHKSPAIVSERYKKVSNPINVQKETEMQDGVGKQKESSYNIISSDGDTLSVSEAGKAANSKKDTMDGIVIQKEMAENRYISNGSTENLSTYSEMELKQMYLDGTITRAKYDEEIRSREKQDETN